MSCSTLAKFERIRCGRKCVFEFFFYNVLESYSSLGMLRGDEMKWTFGSSFLGAMKADLKGHAFVYASTASDFKSGKCVMAAICHFIFQWQSWWSAAAFNHASEGIVDTIQWLCSCCTTGCQSMWSKMSDTISSCFRTDEIAVVLHLPMSHGPCQNCSCYGGKASEKFRAAMCAESPGFFVFVF